MGIPVLVLGASGSGKSCSLRKFKTDEVGVFNVAYKPLPFRNALRTLNTNDYNKILAELKNNSKNCYVIDDSQYLMAFEQISKINELGFEKYKKMGFNFVNLIQTVLLQTSDNTIVYFLHHTERDVDGSIKAKTVGKLIDNWITLEGLFSIVIMADVNASDKYVFITNGLKPCKTPLDMFPEEIENDLKFVDDTIREYYDLEKEK